MAGGRIKRAVKNMLTVYDDHVHKDDIVSFIRFRSESETVKNWGMKDDNVRKVSLIKAKYARERRATHTYGYYPPVEKAIAQSIKPSGATAFYDAVIDAVKLAEADPRQKVKIGSSLGDPNQSFIIALTDGDDTTSKCTLNDATARLKENKKCTLLCIGKSFRIRISLKLIQENKRPPLTLCYRLSLIARPGLKLSDASNKLLTKMCDESDGMFVTAANNDELDKAFETVVEYIEDHGLKVRPMFDTICFGILLSREAVLLNPSLMMFDSADGDLLSLQAPNGPL